MIAPDLRNQKTVMQMVLEKVIFLPDCFYDPFWKGHLRVCMCYEEVTGTNRRAGAGQHRCAVAQAWVGGGDLRLSRLWKDRCKSLLVLEKQHKARAFLECGQWRTSIPHG